MVAVLALVAASTAPSRAVAQDDDARARELFQAGLGLADLGDWPSATASFERALALRDTPAIRLNLARCLEHLDRAVDALTQLDALESGGEAPPPVRASAQELRAALEPRVGRVVVQVRELGPDHRVEIDDRVLDRAQIGEPLPVAPGVHRIRLRVGASTVDDLEIEAAGGGVSYVALSAIADRSPVPEPDRVELAISTGTATGTAPGTATPREPPIAEAWWLWTIVGVVVVGAGVGIGVGVAIGSQPPAPTHGDFTPGVVGIGLVELGR